MSEKIDANIAQCMVTKTHWGYDDYLNVCTGAVSKVDWVAMDYFAAVAVSAVILFFAATIGFLLFMLIRLEID